MVSKMWHIIELVLYFIVYKTFKINMPVEKWKSLLQFIKFGLVGVLNNLICYVTYVILAMLGMHYILANIISFSVSVINSYYWNNKYVFIAEGKRAWWKTFIKTYISYAGTGIVLSNILLILWIEILGISELVGPLLNLMLTVPINYLVNKFWAYKK